jgi:formiminoglutamase
MEHLKLFTQADLNGYTRRRAGEERLGEKIAVLKNAAAIKEASALFAIIGIAEDIGVRANFGRPGAGTAFRAALDSFLNQQSNVFLTGENIMVLGEVHTHDLMEKSEALDPHKPADLFRLRELVSELDVRVTDTIKHIITAGKIPVIIGGGHNNAYGIIRGAAESSGPLSVINCDPHLDFREMEGRHSGNGFSYAFAQGHLHKYAVAGAHEQYNNQHTIQQFRQHPQQLFFNTYESVFVRGEKNFSAAVKECIGFSGKGKCGVELDLDAITNVPSSARTSSGISPVHARQYVHACASKLDAVYLHIAEGAPVLAHRKADYKTGKLIAYLISDFIKATQDKRSLLVGG